MSLKSARDEAQWWVIGSSALFLFVHLIAWSVYPPTSVPRLVASLWLLSGSVTLFLSLFTIPRWQSFVGWIVILGVGWNIFSVP